MPDERDPAFAVIVDVPLDDDVAEQIREDTGIEIRSVAVIPIGGESVQPVAGRQRTASEIVSLTPGSRSSFVVSWVTFADNVDWDTGRTGHRRGLDRWSGSRTSGIGFRSRRRASATSTSAILSCLPWS